MDLPQSAGRFGVPSPRNGALRRDPASAPEDALTLLAQRYIAALLDGHRDTALRLILDAAATGTPVRAIYLRVFQPAQYEIGRLWQAGRISVAQEHYCTAATQLIMSQLYPYVFAYEKKAATAVIVCISGELHEL